MGFRGKDGNSVERSDGNMSMCTQTRYGSKLGLITRDKACRGRDGINWDGGGGRGEGGGQNSDKRKTKSV